MKKLNTADKNINPVRDGKIDLDNKIDIKNWQYGSVNITSQSDEQSISGSAPDTEDITEKTALELAQDVGLYDDTKEDDFPKELDIAEEVNKDEREHNNT